MHGYTAAALDAFRKHELALRAVERTQKELHQFVRGMPEEDMPEYVRLSEEIQHRVWKREPGYDD